MSPPPNTPHTATNPQGHYAAGQYILALTEQLDAAVSSHEAAALADQVLDHSEGVLVRLREFFTTAADRTRATETDEAKRLSHQFTDAVERLEDMETQLQTATEQLRDLGVPEEPELTEEPHLAETPQWRSQVAHYYAAAPQRRPDQASPTADVPESAAPQGPAEQPSQTRHHR